MAKWYENMKINSLILGFIFVIGIAPCYATPVDNSGTSDEVQDARKNKKLVQALYNAYAELQESDRELLDPLSSLLLEWTNAERMYVAKRDVIRKLADQEDWSREKLSMALLSIEIEKDKIGVEIRKKMISLLKRASYKKSDIAEKMADEHLKAL